MARMDLPVLRLTELRCRLAQRRLNGVIEVGRQKLDEGAVLAHYD